MLPLGFMKQECHHLDNSAYNRIPGPGLVAFYLVALSPFRSFFPSSSVTSGLTLSHFFTTLANDGFSSFFTSLLLFYLCHSSATRTNCFLVLDKKWGMLTNQTDRCACMLFYHRNICFPSLHWPSNKENSCSSERLWEKTILSDYSYDCRTVCLVCIFLFT